VSPINQIVDLKKKFKKKKEEDRLGLFNIHILANHQIIILIFYYILL
jgi:hypothetical protein